MNFPLQLTFKLLAIASQIYLRDANGQLIGYVKQKLFKLKEDINVFADENQDRLLYNIKADRVLDFSARYNFTDAAGRPLGSIKRKGMRSIWRAHYDIFDANGAEIMRINEENGWVKVLDSLVGEVPIVGLFTGYLFHPSYIITRADGTQVARLEKQPAFLEGRFQLSSIATLDQADEERILLSSLAMTLLERSRG